MRQIVDCEQELEQDGYNVQAYRLAVRLARENQAYYGDDFGDGGDYWGEWYDEALAKHFDCVVKQNVELTQKVKELEQEVVLLSGAISDAGIML